MSSRKERLHHNSRKQRCKRGHPFDRVDTQGKRYCARCMREAGRRFHRAHPDYQKRWFRKNYSDYPGKQPPRFIARITCPMGHTRRRRVVEGDGWAFARISGCPRCAGEGTT